MPWDGIPGTERQMVTAMTRLRPGPLGGPAALRDHPGPAERPGDRRDRPSLSAGRRTGVTRLTPVALPGLTRPGVRATTAPLLRAQISWALRRLRMRPAAVVSGYLEDVLGRWGPARSTCCTAPTTTSPGAGLMGLSADRLRGQERPALARADVVAVVSPTLADHWSALGADPVLIPNGCSPRPRPLPTAAAAGLPRPVAGPGRPAVRADRPGHPDRAQRRRVRAAHRRPARPAMGSRQRFAALTARPGVHYTGRVPGERRCAAYLAAIDIGHHPLHRQRLQPGLVPAEDARVPGRRPAGGQHRPARAPAGCRTTWPGRAWPGQRDPGAGQRRRPSIVSAVRRDGRGPRRTGRYGQPGPPAGRAVPGLRRTGR